MTLRKFWRYLGNTRKSVDQIKVNNVLTSDHGEIAQHFNAYFQSAFSYPDHPEYNDDSSFSNADFTCYQGVYSILLNLYK